MTDARVTIFPTSEISRIDRRVFGGFVEHLGRHVYDGIHEPTHPTADAQGFRRDVIDLVRELGVSTIRYPGGNFVSGFRWEDSVGPVTERPRRLDLAWHSTETNEVGLHEFVDWLDAVGSDLMLAVNLGTRGIAEALDLVEYTNIAVGTDLSERRRRNGRDEPFDVRMWCLGNEMDGPWQLGYCSADDYGKLAAQTARAIRQLDETVELVACGSSSALMPTFGEWERTVLTHAYDEVDYISAHAYYELFDDDYASFLASGVGMDRFIETVAATADHVQAVRGSTKRMHISFDEWNVWYQTRYREVDRITDRTTWPVAPRLLEDIYSVTDAVVVGSLLMSLLRHADRVRSASIAQLVNVIGPIMTEPGGPAWRQSTFFPFALTSALARDLSVRTEVSGPRMTTQMYGEVDVLDVAATVSDDGAEAALFLVNRATDQPLTVRIGFADRRPARVLSAVSLHDDDPRAANTLADRERVAPSTNRTAAVDDATLLITLPPSSWTAVEIVLG